MKIFNSLIILFLCGCSSNHIIEQRKEKITVTRSQIRPSQSMDNGKEYINRYAQSFKTSITGQLKHIEFYGTVGKKTNLPLIINLVSFSNQKPDQVIASIPFIHKNNKFTAELKDLNISLYNNKTYALVFEKIKYCSFELLGPYDTGYDGIPSGTVWWSQNSELFDRNLHRDLLMRIEIEPWYR